MERRANVESKATLQIRGPYFVAVLVLDEERERVVRADRELDFTVGWTLEKVMSYVHVQKWEWKVIEG